MAYTKLLWVAALGSAALSGQWLDYKTPGIPRTSDGKPDLKGPAPKAADGKPDLSGLWQVDGIGNSIDIFGGRKIEMTPAAKAILEQRLTTYGQEEPTTYCMPAGPKAGLFGASPFRIVQSPNMTVMLYEDGALRQIYSDGRPLPTNPNPSWMGYSTARWESDTYVIRTNGYNDKSWLDYLGHPHSEDLVMTERVRRTDFGHISMEITFEDSKFYPKPLSAHFTMTYQPDSDLLEYICAENERDGKHLIGVVADEKTREVKVPQKTLEKYDGSYEFAGFGVVKVTHKGAGLEVQLPGGDASSPALAQSEKKFMVPSIGGTLEFVSDASGKVTHALMTTVEGEDRGEKKN